MNTDMKSNRTVKGLVCHECGERYPERPEHVCEMCFGPLDIEYDLKAAKDGLTRSAVQARPATMWRYAELLPVAVDPENPPLAPDTGMTPLVKAERLASWIGVDEVWVKNDTVSHPSLSFKDRVVAVAIAKARDFGLPVIACASTGNLAHATGALAASVQMPSVVLMPDSLEATKLVGTAIYGAKVIAVRGTYDDANRLCSEVTDKYGWGSVNVNLRPYYTEGAKSYTYEIAEQLGWRAPAHVVAPLAGGSLLTKIDKAFGELRELGLIDSRPDLRPKIHGAQAFGCAPIVNAVREKREFVPIRNPQTAVSSLAIGNPADGVFAVDVIRQSGGFAAAPTDQESLEGARALAENEGIFTELGGGVVVAAARSLVRSGHIKADDGPLVLAITAHGLKTQETIATDLPPAAKVEANLKAFTELVDSGDLSGYID